MVAEFIDSSKAILQMGISSIAALNVWLQRHPEFKPKHTIGGAFAWTQLEIQAVISARAGRERGGVPTHKGPRKPRTYRKATVN